MLGGRSAEGVWGEAFGRASDIAARKLTETFAAGKNIGA